MLRALRDAGVNLIAFWVREQRSSSPCSGIARAASVLAPPHRRIWQSPWPPLIFGMLPHSPAVLPLVTAPGAQLL